MKSIINKFFILICVFFYSNAYALNSTVSLDVSGSGPLAKVGKLMQEFVDFLGGPGVLFVTFIGVAAAIALWIFVPKGGSAVIGYIARTAAGGVVLMNLAIVLTWFQSF